jgi:hypothetical protein
VIGKRGGEGKWKEPEIIGFDENVAIENLLD